MGESEIRNEGFVFIVLFLGLVGLNAYQVFLDKKRPYLPQRKPMTLWWIFHRGIIFMAMLFVFALVFHCISTSGTIVLCADICVSLGSFTALVLGFIYLYQIILAACRANNFTFSGKTLYRFIIVVIVFDVLLTVVTYALQFYDSRYKAIRYLFIATVYFSLSSFGVYYGRKIKESLNASGIKSTANESVKVKQLFRNLGIISGLGLLGCLSFLTHCWTAFTTIETYPGKFAKPFILSGYTITVVCVAGFTYISWKAEEKVQVAPSSSRLLVKSTITDKNNSGKKMAIPFSYTVRAVDVGMDMENMTAMKEANLHLQMHDLEALENGEE